MVEKFWQTKTLAKMTNAEWESLCDGCGKCCLHKIIEDDTDEIHFTNVACELLNTKSCRCKKYEKRFKYVSDCFKVTLDDIDAFHWLPESCSYKRLLEGNDIPEWHPLITGSQSEMHKLGYSIRGKAVAESQAGDLEDHIITFKL
ncbi:YcgN family cysteine cluster protein [Moritella viscosa]|uniref:UPF0260 protein MT2528_3690 n=1 Tax=Moritella viscosa TaxID=80854 RepID=A0A090IGV5_9GAMM|nr:YcgN family cysteine cluster protein [Moritella viscosa]CED60212.1 UPF0260 protein [Moritella viscosa]SGY98696.1 UPF0260 protein PE36_11317 [Moritella viscosa]SGZ05625.1 UPF0260 protein PE36_11317 [Moritella viscosa]SGZ05796.1 UPF0260 protein PE36_11317 [Moritella viscosa]SGZ12816.1 UPF0260 protein PE36_11317 [Moritella viscosa]